jgi:hypothetical protein
MKTFKTAYVLACKKPSLSITHNIFLSPYVENQASLPNSDTEVLW